MPNGRQHQRRTKPEQRAGHRIQVRVSDATFARVLRDVERTGKNKSAVCNDILEEHYGVGKKKRRVTRRARTAESAERDRLEERVRELMHGQNLTDPAARRIAEAEQRAPADA